MGPNDRSSHWHNGFRISGKDCTDVLQPSLVDVAGVNGTKGLCSDDT